MGESAGEGRWSAERKRAIYDSRIESTHRLVAAAGRQVRSFICASAIGIYPDAGERVLGEGFALAPTDDFMQRLCRDWEAAARLAEDRGMRSVSLRIGIVFGDGGLLRTLLPLFKAGLGGPIGDGQQWLPRVYRHYSRRTSPRRRMADRPAARSSVNPPTDTPPMTPSLATRQRMPSADRKSARCRSSMMNSNTC